MELLNKFRETIFLKEDSDIEKQIEELKCAREKINDKKGIDKDIKLLEFGMQGEKNVAYELKNTNIGMYIIHDATIQFEDLKAQIDYIIITKGYCYLVECKNLTGNLIVDYKGEFVREYMYNGKMIKEAMYSPYTQALRHKEILKKRWLNNNSKIKTLLSEKYFDELCFKPIVVLSNSKAILNTKYAPKKIRDNIVRVDKLLEYIEKDVSKYQKDLLSSKNQMLELGIQLLAMCNKNYYNNFLDKYKVNDNENIEKVKIDSKNEKNDDKLIIEKNKNNDLEQKLRNFRKNKSVNKHIPAYYIFTDEEMNKIIQNKPQSFEQLSNMKILSDVKLKLHGQEIIEIINEK